MIASFVSPLVLDRVKGAVAAYSLRKLTSFASKAITIRRSSDDAELDIGFNGIDLDVPSLKSFVGNDSAYIKTWYDQSGYNNHANQTTTNYQPRIINAGVLDVDANGKPKIQTILASDTHLIVNDANSLDFTTNASFNVVHNPANVGEGNLGRIIDKGTAYSYNLAVNTKLVGLGSSSTSNDGSYSFNTININTITHNSVTTSGKYYINGNEVGSQSVSVRTANSTNLFIFNRTDLTRQYDGSMSELILFNKTLTNEERLKLEKNQGKYYGISV